VIDELLPRILAREPAAVARAISLVEDRRASAEPRIVELLRKLAQTGRGASGHRVGVTGPPGVGKSSLLSALVRHARASGRSVGVLAVDPSSPYSGGALLGDRARIETDADDIDVFIRSMASGGQLGGLARAAAAAVEVLAAVYDLVLIETTGVGQSETDIEHVADTVLLVIQPGSGDVLQFIKAGILEIPDILAVNKADLGAIADRALSELGSALRVTSEGRANARVPPLLRTSATSGEGVSELLAALDAHRSELQGEALRARRIDKSARWALRLFTQRYGEVGDNPGYLVNRLLVPYILHAIETLEHGVATPEAIDTAMKLGCGHPLGPLALADLIGLDVVFAMSRSLYQELGDTRYRCPSLLRRLVMGGSLGKKSGIGFYRYGEGEPQANAAIYDFSRPEASVRAAPAA
jgi:LAO/AO transport system kinase